MDHETTTFLTAMRESIESKVDANGREGRESVQRVEAKLSDLSREMGETTMALRDHKSEDDKLFDQMNEDVKEVRAAGQRTLRSKVAGGVGVASIPAAMIAILEYLKNGSTH